MLRTVKLPPLSSPDPPLDDGTVALRLITVTDIPDLVTACQDPDIPRWTTVPSPYSEAEAEAWLAGQEAGMASGHALPLAIVSSAGGELLGAIEVGQRGDGVGEIGYWVAPWARRRGVASAALRLLSGWAIGYLGLKRLQLKADVRNEASQAVALRAGYRREGVLRSYVEMKGERRDMVIFSLLPGDRAGDR
jgi:RimJ/RimL family protein N-acetyltransferase